jgi:TolB-like protein
MASRLPLFLAELKRRKVYHVAAVYAAVGVAISVAVPDLFGAFGFPSWAAALVIVVIAIGFPIALVLAWAYEVRPEQPRIAEPFAGGPPRSKPKGRMSIIVLPFDNMSPDPGDAYFSDGLTEEIITALSHIQSMRVISRNSAMALKGTRKDTRTIARELDVKYVLEGSVRKAGDDLRITAQLIDAGTDEHLWAEKYDGVLDDVFEMQEQVSRSIVGALEVELTAAELSRLVEPPVKDVAAHECLLKARADVLLMTEASLDRALTLLDRGIETVGENDALYAEKSHVYMQYVNTQSKPVDEFPALLEKGRALATRALAINPSCGRAEFSLGVFCNQTRDPGGAIHHWGRAFELNPSDALAAAFLGFQLAACGRDLGRARKACRTAAELDPLTPVNKGALGWVHIFECDFDGALAGWREWQRDAEGAKSQLPRLLLAWLHAESGDLDEAFRLFEQMAHDSPDHTLTILGTVLKHALLGEKKQALDAVDYEVEQAAWWDDFYAYVMTQVFALIGELDRGARWLDHAIDYGFCNPYFLAHEPLLENLRSDERFGSLAAKAKRLSESLSD